jgi:hypothetical protein
MDRSVPTPGRWLLALGFAIASVTCIAPVQGQELCGGVDYPFPYTDVSSVGPAFCPGIMEAYVTGVSKGTTPTTFSPDETVSRVQMTTFLQRSLDQGLARTSRRAALNQWWISQNAMQSVAVGSDPQACAADGEDIWTTAIGVVVQVHANTGKVLGTWTGDGANGVVVALGRVFITGGDFPTGTLYMIDPTMAPGAATAVGTLGGAPSGIAFDGSNLWTANTLTPGSVSIITPQASTPYPITTVSTGFIAPFGILYDGGNIWITDLLADALKKLDSSGNILQTVPVGHNPRSPVFDGTNIWVPNEFDNSITVVQASTGNVVATITSDASNNLSSPEAASFDGERVLVTNNGNSTVTLFKAADLSFIANVAIGTTSEPYGVCSDGINFWVDLNNTNAMMRF